MIFCFFYFACQAIHCLRALLCNIEGDVDLCTFRMLILMWYFLHSERALKISPFQQQQLLNLNMGDYDETISPSMQEKLWMSKLCHLWTRIPTQYTKKMGFQDISPCSTNSALFILCQITTGSNFEVYIGKAVQPPELLGVGAIGNVGPNPKWPTICDNPITPPSDVALWVWFWQRFLRAKREFFHSYCCHVLAHRPLSDFDIFSVLL